DFLDQLDNEKGGEEEGQPQLGNHHRDYCFQKKDDDLSQRAQVQVEVQIEIEQAILLDWNKPNQEMEIGVEEIFDEKFTVHVDHQDVGEDSRVRSARPRNDSCFRINTDALDFPLCLAVLNDWV